MRIDDDARLYEFTRLFDGNGDGTALLMDYWRRSGKLEKLCYVIGDGALTARAEDLAHVVACENSCERLYGALVKFLASGCCARSAGEYTAKPEVRAAVGELVRALKSGYGSPRRGGWQSFFAALDGAVSLICELTERLMSFDAAGSPVRFETTADARSLMDGSAGFDVGAKKRLVFLG